MPYSIYKSDGSLFLRLEDGQVDTSFTSLTLLGKNVINYGQYENTNNVHMLENFASSSEPANPLAGQLWFNKDSTVLRLNVYNGSLWNSIPNFTLSTSTPTLNTGDFWWDTSNEVLYIKNTSTLTVIGGPRVASLTANRLTTATTINGVLYDGSSNITISSTISNYLNVGSYLLGSNFNGSAATTISVDVGTVTEATPSKVVARDSSGHIYFNLGVGTATASRYADLAEKYLTDKEYDQGTVVVIGGEAEVTASSIGKRAIGVVSLKPGFMMNETLDKGTYIALKGRVPVKVDGSISKGQRLIAGDNGKAIGVNYPHIEVFAIALTDSLGSDTVEALIL